MHSSSQTIRCPACGHQPPLDDLLGQFERRGSLMTADGGTEQDARDRFEQRCRKCEADYSVSYKQVGTLLIERQMQDLFASIATTIRGKSTLQ